MTLDFDHLGNLFFTYVIDFAGAVLIAVVGWWLAGVIERGTRRVLMSSPHMDLTVGTFLSSLARYATLVIVFVIILQVIGVQATSLVAVIGAASPATATRSSRSIGRSSATASLFALAAATVAAAHAARTPPSIHTASSYRKATTRLSRTQPHH